MGMQGLCPSWLVWLTERRGRCGWDYGASFWYERAGPAGKREMVTCWCARDMAVAGLTRSYREAWKQQNGLSRTEAKRQYITTLIDTMHKYASSSPDSRELVAELEFVWDQVKSNVPSSSSSSPMQTMSQMGLQYPPPHYPQPDSSQIQDEPSSPPLQIKSPMTETDEALSASEAEADPDRDEFVDAPDSQYNPFSDAGGKTEAAKLGRQDTVPYTPTRLPRIRHIVPQPIPTPAANPNPPSPPHDTPADQKWRKRIEATLIRMTAEVAALREQLEARRLFVHPPHYRFFRGLWRLTWAGLKHVAVDVLILGMVLLWMRRRKDRRLEGAVRVLLGDAVAQVQKVGGGKLVKVLPGIGKKGGGEG